MKRRPTFMLLLSKFYDGKGDPMSWAWQTKAEKKARKKAERDAEVREAAIGLMGDPSAFEDIRAKLDKRAHGLLNKILRRRLNPRSDNIEVLNSVSRPVAELVTALRAKPQTMRDLTDTLVTRCAQSQASAQRTAYSLVSVLTACERAKRVGPFVELT